MRTIYAICGLLIFMAVPAFFAVAQAPANSNGTSSSDKVTATHSSDKSTKDTANATDDAAERLEGEKRFRTNCGRCHMPPHKFPPRVMATAVRHMRVRAMLTEDDMRLILKYMTQ